MRNFVIGVLVALLFVFSSLGGVIADRIVGLNILDKYIPRNVREQIRETKVLSEDEYLSEMLEKVGPAVVTVAVKGTRPERGGVPAGYRVWVCSGCKKRPGRH